MDRFQKRKQTKERRRHQICKVFEVKIDKSKLSQETVDHLRKWFTEAKYFYNYCAQQDNINKADTTIKCVPVRVLGNFENRTLSVLTGAQKQGIKTSIFSSIMGLHTLKKNGYKVGRIRFKSFVNSINLQQYNKTHFIDFANSRIRLQGIAQKMRVSGLGQISPDDEIANAHLVRKCGEYYLHITTYRQKIKSEIPDVSVGIDFGCQTQLTLSNGIKIEYEVPIPKKLRRLDRKIQKSNRPKSKKKQQDRWKREKVYQHLRNRKKDNQNKIVSAITKNVKRVCFQDENIHAWHSGNHGKKIQNTGIGGIIRDLKLKSHTPIEVDKFFPSTQLCPVCEHRQKLTLDQRIYKCEICGYEKDRDWKSAICIEEEGLKNSKVPVGYREVKAEETKASAQRIFNSLKGVNGLRASFVDDSGKPHNHFGASHSL